MKTCKKCNVEKDESEFYYCPSINKLYNYCKDCTKEISKEWNINNKDKNNASKRALRKIPQHKIANRGRVQIRKIIRDLTPGYKFLNQCGAHSRTVFMEHLESTVPEGYNLDRDYGSILCVDHYIPCSAFDLTKQDEYERCFNYKNLRIVTISENLSKGKKVPNA